MSATQLVIWLLAGTGGLYVLGRFVATHYGVGDRRLETGRPYSAASLAAWVEADGNRAARYAVPVLLPIDLLFMIGLGGILAAASVTLAANVAILSGVAWLFALLPAVYVAADLVEDVALARLLTDPRTITDAAVRRARALTRVKLWSLGLGLLQIVTLAIAGSMLRCS